MSAQCSKSVSLEICKEVSNLVPFPIPNSTHEGNQCYLSSGYFSTDFPQAFANVQICVNICLVFLMNFNFYIYIYTHKYIHTHIYTTFLKILLYSVFWVSFLVNIYSSDSFLLVPVQNFVMKLDSNLFTHSPILP